MIYPGQLSFSIILNHVMHDTENISAPYIYGDTKLVVHELFPRGPSNGTSTSQKGSISNGWLYSHDVLMVLQRSGPEQALGHAASAKQLSRVEKKDKYYGVRVWVLYGSA